MQRGAGSEDESTEWERPRRSRTDVTACVRGRIKFVEKVSADASHKKSGKVVPRRRMAELEEFIQCLSDTKTADTASS